MSNTLSSKIVVTLPTTDDTQPDARLFTPGPAVESEMVVETTAEGSAPVPIPEARPVGGTAEIREFIAMLRRERKARARRRHLKRAGWALGALALAVFLIARGDGENGKRAPTGRAPEPAVTPGEAPSADPAGALPPASWREGLLAGEGAADPLGEAGPCEENFAQQRWRAAAESCTQLFDEAPRAALALRIAHAHWSRGQAQEASTWAHKALGLGSRDADAFVIIGHAERQAGRTSQAAAAYRRYLEWSPRGWHAKRLRAALRELEPKPAYRQPSARRNAEATL